MSADEAQAPTEPRLGWRVVRAVLLGVAVWIGLDLLAGLELPGASVVEQLAFALVVELPVYAIFAGPLLVPVVGALVGAAWWGRSRWPGGWVFVVEGAQAVVWATAATVGLVGILKWGDPAVLGLVGVVLVGRSWAVWWRKQDATGGASAGASAGGSAADVAESLVPEPRSPSAGSALPGAVAVAVAAVPLLVAAVQLYAFVWSDALWRLLIHAVDEGAGPRALMRLPSALAAIGLAVALFAPVRFDRLTTDRLVPTWAPRMLLAALLLGQLGHARSFAGPYFSLWTSAGDVGDDGDGVGGDGAGAAGRGLVQRLDREPSRVHPEAFRLAASDDGRWLLVVYRQSTQLARYDLRTGEMRWLLPDLPGEGTLENVVWDEAGRRFLVSFELDDPGAGDWLVSIDERGESKLIAVPNHGWIASMLLLEGGGDGDGTRRLLLGYEARPTLVVFELATASVVDVITIASLGDVEEAVAVGGRVYTVPLHHPWGLHLNELDLDSGKLLRRLLVGGANQELEVAGEFLLIGRYYASRVEVVDRVAWKKQAPFEVGFGVRAIAADVERGVVVTGGQYAGQLRLHDLETRRRLMTLPSCGYVKDLVIVDGHVVFASLCGVFRVDLDAALEAVEPVIGVQLLGVIAALLVVFGLPGALASRLFVPVARPAERLVLSGVCAFSVGPLLLYLITTFANLPMTPPLIWGASLVASLAMGLALWRRDRPVLPVPPAPGPVAIAALVAVAFVVLLAGSVQPIGGVDVFATIHHCMYVMVMYAVGNDPSVGVPLYDGIDGGVISMLSHHPHDPLNGLRGLFGEQRPGNVAILAPHVSLFGTLGWLTAPVMASLVGAGACFCAARELGASRAASGLAVAAGMLGVHAFLGYVINENLFGFALLSFLAWTGVKRELSAGWLVLAGVVLAHVVGVRYTAILFWPALAWRFRPLPRVAHGERGDERGDEDALLGRPARRAALWALPAGLLTVPWLALNVAMLDKLVAHPAVRLNFDDTVVTNHWPLLGRPFEFKALNYPFVDEVVRGPWNAFPTFLWLPLQAVQEFGTLFVAAALAGALILWLVDSPRGGFLLAFALPHALAIAWLENLNRAQLTYAVLGMAPLLIWVAVTLHEVGIERWTTSPPQRRQARLLTALALGGVLLGTVGARSLDYPADRRQAGEVRGYSPVPDTLRRGLTTNRVLPAVAPVDVKRLAHLGAALANQRWTRGDGSYPSGGVALMVPFGRDETTEWRFELEGAPPREPGAPFRSSQGLQTVTVTLPAARVSVAVSGEDGDYRVRFEPLGPSPETAIPARDFTFFIHGWDQVTESTALYWKGDPLDGRRFEQTAEDGEWRVGISTNYPPAVVGLSRLAYTVDLGDYEAACGYFTFVGDGGGGHRHEWDGKASGTLLLPRGSVADRAIFLPNPWCRMGPPQPGARYAEVAGPFVEGQTLKFVVDQEFGVRGGGWLEFHDPPGGP